MPVSASVPPTEEWMKGFAKPRIKKENLATNEELQVLFDKASALYKN